MFKEAGLTEELKNAIWSEGVSTATLLENRICTPLKKVPAYEKFYEREQKNVRISLLVKWRSFQDVQKFKANYLTEESYV